MVRGIERKLDELGRVTLPMEMRRSLGFKEHEKVDIYLNGKTICIEPAKKCMCCEAPEDLKNGKELIEYNDAYICQTCLGHFNEKAGN